MPNIISHYGLTRSGELLSTDEEVAIYETINMSKTSSTNDVKSTNSIANLKMLHAGGLISVAGKNLFISQILVLIIILIYIFIFSYGQEYPEYLSPDNIGSIIVFNGIILSISIILQLKGFSSLYYAGEIFKTKD